MIRLYGFASSTNVERVALALAHKRLPAEVVVIDPDDRSVVRAVSGQDLVPVIDDDGTVVSDSTAILRYLEERYPEAPLFPPEPARRAEMETFLDWFNGVWKRPPNALVAELEGPAPDAARVAQLTGEIVSACDRFEALLDGRDYLLGDVFSAADCAAYPFLKYAVHKDPDDPYLFHRLLMEHQTTAGRPRFAAWIARMDERPKVPV